jgi:hypothetical protein
MGSSLRFDTSRRPISLGVLRGAPLCRRFGIAIILLVLLFSFNQSAMASVTASIVGSVKDQTGAVVPDAQVTVTNTGTTVKQTVTTNADGSYIFPTLLPGNYEVTIHKPEFKTFIQRGIVLTVNEVLTVDAALAVGSAEQQVIVSGDVLNVETQSTQMGEVIEAQQITSVPLNGRSYTDLLDLQPGVANTSTVMGGGSSPSADFESGMIVVPPVSGSEDSGNLSVDGMRESQNGFLLNGLSVQEFAYSGTAIIPNLDSLSEFRIITNNFDAEYGGFAGGQVNVITKTGADELHGELFDFLRNTDVDAANYFDQGQRGAYQQNQFGGTVGGPIKKGKVFFFADYQGNRTNEGISTGLIDVPTSAERSGDFSAPALESAMSGYSVVGTPWANTLSNELGYTVTAGEPYYTSGCTSPSVCVFPNAQIPASAITPIAKNSLALGAFPLGNGQGTFFTSAYPETLTDNKFSGRVDTSPMGIGALSGYYYFDQFSLYNPYPDATVPGFGANTTGRSQVIDLADTKTMGSSAVDVFRVGYLRLNYGINTPASSIKTTLGALGFATSGPGAMTPLNPVTEGIPEMDFENFTIGQVSHIPGLIENTFEASDSYSKLIGTHSLKFGAEYRKNLLAEDIQNAENGDFQFDETLETGVDFADFLIGAAGSFGQGQTPPLNSRMYYLGLFAQDSWRVRQNLTLNYGLRYDIITPWWEDHNHLETYIVGEQSVLFPNAPTGYVVPGDPGVVPTISPIGYDNFSPRVGLAYSPSGDSGLLKKLFGDPGDTSIHIGYGMFYMAFEAGYNFSIEGDAPYGNWHTQEQTYLATPFTSRATGVSAPNPFPVTFPPANVSSSNPDTAVTAANFGTLSGNASFGRNNRVPYAEQYEMSIQRRLSRMDVLTISYVGTQAHRLLVGRDINPVNEAACLALYNQDPSNPSCGPNNEPYTLFSTFGMYGNSTTNIENVGQYDAIGPSSYNSLQIEERHQSGPLTFMAGYTLSKSMDDASGFSEPVNPFNPNLDRALSSFNIPQSFILSYDYHLPINRLSGPNVVTQGWALSGITTFSVGEPIFIFENNDSSLLETDNTGPMSIGIDKPDYSGGRIHKLNPRQAGNPYFVTTGFTTEPIGQVGTSNRSFFSGPGLNDFDMALLKDTKITERFDLQFRAEFFNVFNHTQFQAVPQTAGNFLSSQFGDVTSAAAPRIGQFALKLRF